MPETLDDALITEFIADSLEHLERVEPALLTLEESGSHVDPDIVHQVFRAVHTIKGSSGFFWISCHSGFEPRHGKPPHKGP